MNKFLFITHMTPKAKRSEFRQALINTYFKALNGQSYGNWKVIIFGDEERTEGRFHYFIRPDVVREKKTGVILSLLQKQEVAAMISEADYIIKLDDDDLISPQILERLSTFDGDVYYDRLHTFVDVSSGTITQQERPWMASTCVHRKECAFAPWTGPGASGVGNLLYSDHSKSWHLYYETKNKVTPDPSEPVYLRVLSPTSITSGAPGESTASTMKRYYEYLAGFGDWKTAPVGLFDIYLSDIRDAWRQYSGSDWNPIPARALIPSLLRRLGF